MNLKNLVMNLILIAGSLLLTAGAMELVFRLFMEPPQSVRLVDNNKNKAVTTNIKAVENQGVFIMTPNGRRLKPNLDVIIENHRLSKEKVRMKTNSLGHRGSEPGNKTSPRILFLGDSVTNQAYFSEEKTWVHQLQEMARSHGSKVQMINAGVASISLQDEFAILHETGIKTDPDLVVVAFYLNDFLPSNAVKITNPPSFLDWSYLARFIWTTVSIIDFNMSQHWDPTGEFIEEVKVYSNETTKNVEQTFDVNEPLKKEIVRASMDWGMGWSESAWEKYRVMLEQFQKTARENQFELAIVMFPVRAQIEHPEGSDSNYPQVQAKRITEEMGITFHDTLPAHKNEYQKNKTDLFFDHCHHNEAGSRLVAEDLYGFLAKEYPRFVR